MQVGASQDPFFESGSNHCGQPVRATRLCCRSSAWPNWGHRQRH